MKNILVIILFAQFLTFTNVQAALELVDPDYDGNVALRAGSLGAGIMPQYTNQVGLDGVENIRVSAGTVNLVHTDISMPVSSDLSIDIIRYYTSPAKTEFGHHNDSYTGGKSALGIGWDIHMGRIRGIGYRKIQGDTCRPERASDLPVLELSDGSSYQLFNAKTTGKGAIKYTLITENYWVADCIPEGMVVHSPDGYKYFFTEHSYVKDRERSVFSVTRVEDKNGNYYTVSYKDISIWNTDDLGVPIVTIRGVSEITTRDNRKIIFNYASNGRLSSVVTPTQTWLYAYENERRSGYDDDFYLRSVTGPEEYRWRYDYIRSSDYKGWQEDINAGRGSDYGWYQVPGIFGLKQIITPYGAHVDYEYHLREFEPLSTSIISAIAKKTVTGPGIDVPRVWTYKADDAISAYDSVLDEFTWESSDIEIMPYIADISIEDKANSRFYKIEGPDTIEILQFCETVTNNSPVYDAWSCVSQGDRAISKRLFKKKVDSQGNEDIANIELIQDITYTRLFHTDITDMTRGVTVMFPVDIQVSVKRGDEYFNTITSNFDDFYNPSLISEFTGTPLTIEQLTLIDPVTGGTAIPDELGRLLKQTRYTYVSNIVRGDNVNIVNDKWIIGLLESVTIVDSVDAFLSVNTPNLFNVYDSFGNITSSKKHNLETLYTYEQKLVLNASTGQNESVPTGEIASITDPLNKVTSFSYYKYGIAQEERSDTGVTTVKVVNDAGNVESYRNGRGLLERYTYDLLNRVKTIDTPRTDDNNIVFDYAWTGPAFNYTKTVGSYVETVRLNGLGQAIEINKGGIKTTLNYDVTGRRNFVSNPNSTQGLAVVYDSLGRTTETTNTVDNTKTTYTYPSNLQTSITDEEGKETVLTYRAFSDPDKKELMVNEQKSASDGSIVTIIDRTQRGDVYTVKQGKSSGAYSGNEATLTELKKRLYTYDDNYFVDQIHYPETGWSDVQKNAVGNQLRRQVDIDEPGVTPSGITNYIYDDLHRLETIVYPALTTPNLIYAYDENDNVIKITSGGVVLDYTYDLNDNLETETLTIDGTAYTTAYTYDANNALNTVEYPDGLIIDYKPNALGQATEVSGFVSAITYHHNGQINTLNYLNGQNITINQNSRLFTESVVAGISTDTVNMSYTYDAAGNTKTITDSIAPVNDLTLGYDAFNRLTQADGSWGSGLVEYNSRGNILRKVIGSTDLTYNYNDNGNGTKLGTITNTQAGTNQYSFNYDVYGNVETNGTNQFIYNDASHLTDVTNQNYTYRYDGNDNRAVIDENGYLRYSMYGKLGSLLYEYDKSKEIKTAYIRVGSYLVARRDDLGVCPVLDTDGDTIPDCDEYRAGLDPNLISDGVLDKDDDGLLNAQEYTLGTDIGNEDSDGDGIPDGFEVDNQLDPLNSADAALDNDGDTLINLSEYQMSLVLYVGLDLNKKDTDADGLDDNYEIIIGLSPVSEDSDNDRIHDGYEVANNLDLQNDDSELDKDGDGYSNFFEFSTGSSSLDANSIPQGSSRWSFYGEGGIQEYDSRAIALSDVVYAVESRPNTGSNIDLLYAIDPKEIDIYGNVIPKWSIEIKGGAFTELVIDQDDTVYFGGEAADEIPNALIAINKNGNKQWEWVTKEDHFFYDPPAIAINGNLILHTEYFNEIEPGNDEFNLISITKNGKPDWVYPYSSGFLGSPVIGLNGNVYSLTNDGHVLVVSSSGVFVNTYKPPLGVFVDDIIVGPNGKIYTYQYVDATGLGEVVILNDDGTLDQILPVKEGEIADLLITADDLVAELIVEYYDGEVIAVDLTSRVISWRYTPDKRITTIAASPSKQGLIIASHSDNSVSFFQKDNDAIPVNGVYPGELLWSVPNSSQSKTLSNGDLLTFTNDLFGNWLHSTSTYQGPLNINVSANSWASERKNNQNTGNACNENTKDTDSDGIPDCYEIQYGLSITNSADALDNNDTDSLNNLTEYLNHTDPNLPDTDGDGLDDDVELRFALSPLLIDTDADGMPDIYEWNNGLDPINDDADLDLDNDGVSNLNEYIFNTAAIDPVSAPVEGRRILSVLLGSTSNLTKPVLSNDGTVYVAEDNGNLYSIDTKNAVVNWQYQVFDEASYLPGQAPKIVEPPSIALDGTVYVIAGKNLYSINPLTQIENWNFPVTGSKINNSLALGEDGNVYIVDDLDYFYAINNAGFLIRSQLFVPYYDTRTISLISPSIGYDGLVYFASSDDREADSIDDRLLSYNPLDNSFGSLSLSYVSNNSYQINQDARLVVSNTNGGYEVIFNTDKGDLGLKNINLTDISSLKTWNSLSDETSNPVVGSDGKIYTISKSSLSVRNSGLKVVDWDIPPLPINPWFITESTFKITNGIYSPIVTADGTVFFINRSGEKDTLYAIKNGVTKWQRNFASNIAGMTLGTDGVLYVTTLAGELMLLTDINSGYDGSHWPMLGHDHNNSNNVSLHHYSYNISITAPATDLVITPGVNTTLSASALENGTTDQSANLVWTSSIDGELGTGASISAILSSGQHVITAQIRNAQGYAVAVQTTKVTVENGDMYPSLHVSSPTEGERLTSASLNLEAIAADNEDGDLANTIQWISDIDGAIGTGGTLVTNLSPGQHTITASITDSASHRIEVTRNIRVPSPWDQDADGMSDAWELSQFGTLDRDGTGDFDTDGVLDLAAYQAYTSVPQDGNANGDSELNVADLLLLQRHVLGQIVLPDIQKARVDLYPSAAPDGILNIQDMILMHRLLMGAQ